MQSGSYLLRIELDNELCKLTPRKTLLISDNAPEMIAFYA